MKNLLLASAILLSLSATAAHAGDKSYTFVEGGYTNIDRDADGAFLRGNYEFGKSGVFATGGAARYNLDNTNIDVNAYELGLGYKYSLNDRFDVYAEAVAARMDVDFVGNLDGYRAAVGTRFDITPKFEGEVKFNHYNGHDFVSNNTATVGAQYKFGSSWGIVSSVEFDSGVNTYNLGVRKSF